MAEQTINWPGHFEKQAAPTPSLAVVLPDQARKLEAFGTTIYVHFGGEQTGGRYTLFTEITPPGGGPPPHYHTEEDEWFVPLEGRVEFFLNGAWEEVPMGTVVFIPRNTVHTFRNCGEAPLKMLIHTSPSGFETFFERCAAVFAKPGPPDMARISEIGAEHGIHFVTE